MEGIWGDKRAVTTGPDPQERAVAGCGRTRARSQTWVCRGTCTLPTITEAEACSVHSVCLTVCPGQVTLKKKKRETKQTLQLYARIEERANSRHLELMGQAQGFCGDKGLSGIRFARQQELTWPSSSPKSTGGRLLGAVRKKCRGRREAQGSGSDSVTSPSCDFGPITSPP